MAAGPHSISKTCAHPGQFVAISPNRRTSVIKLQAERILLVLELKESICISGTKVPNIVVGREMKLIICQQR